MCIRDSRSLVLGNAGKLHRKADVFEAVFLHQKDVYKRQVITPEMIRNLRMGRNAEQMKNCLLYTSSSYGGSTLTQQLIKNVSGDDSYKIQRKIQEILWAVSYTHLQTQKRGFETYEI